LHHFASADLAGIFRTARHDHLELRRDNVEPFRDVLADPVLKAAAARAGLVGHVDDDLFAWEVDRQRTAIDVPPARRGLLLSGGVVLRRGVCRSASCSGSSRSARRPKRCRCSSLMIAVNRSSSSA
jgi:hypothetical protein